MTFRIAVLSDTHLGYAARCRAHPTSGINMRVRDGYLGLRETVDAILAEPNVDIVLHGGDLFHRSHPDVASIAFARKELHRITDASIPVIAVTGNHDFANERGKSPATAAIDDASRNLRAVVEPLDVFRPADGITLHVISHVGLVSAERAMPTPIDGEVNILLSHGAAQVPGHEIFTCIDSPGEAVIGYDVLTMPWNVSLLGHYHGMGPLPGFDTGDTGQAWYVGSLLRRGFSDPEGGRGWLLVSVEPDGKVTVERRFVHQRPQFDLPAIDAAGLTGGDVEERIKANLESVDVDGAILRQRVTNCPLAVRRGMDSATIHQQAADALLWQLEFVRPPVREFAESTESDADVESLRTAGAADLPGMWDAWFPGYRKESQLPGDVADKVHKNARSLITEVSETVETGSEAATQALGETA